jgi:hypothetical protein
MRLVLTVMLNENYYREMLDFTKKILIISCVGLICSCSVDVPMKELENLEPPPTIYPLEKFNDLSTFFHLDSVIPNDRNLNFYFTDTSRFYQPERHIQNFNLSLLTVLNYKELSLDYNSVSFDVTMPYREDGDIIENYSVIYLTGNLDRYNLPEVKKKIIELNKANRSDFLASKGTKTMDIIYSLNQYFVQTESPGNWFGVDAYDVIWKYEYNKTIGMDVSHEAELFNNILTDTRYMKEREIGSKIHEILVK